MKRHNLAHPFFITTIVDARNQEAAINWIIDNQLGRRNLTETQRTYLIGKRYITEKKVEGAPVGNKNAEKQLPQNDEVDLLPIKVNPISTAQNDGYDIAKEPKFI